MGKTIWELFQQETGINYYFYEQNNKKNYFHVYNALFTKEEKNISSDNCVGIFICKSCLFDDSGKYIGKPFYPTIGNMQAFARDNRGEFLGFEEIVLNHKFKGEELTWYEEFKKEFFPFIK